MPDGQITLSLREPYKSIQDLPKTDLPNFCVITGENGAGKTHLLEGIRDGRIVVAGLKPTGCSPVHFNWETFLPNVGSLAKTGEVARKLDEKRTNWQSLWSLKWSSLESMIGSWKRSEHSKLKDRQWLARANQTELADVISETRYLGTEVQKTALGLALDFIAARDKAELELEDHSRHNSPLLNQDFVTNPILARARESFAHDIPLGEVRASPLSLGLAEWFLTWELEFKTNRLNRFEASQGGNESGALSDSDFREKHGMEPWELLTNVLARAGSRFGFNKPDISLRKTEDIFHIFAIERHSAKQLRVEDLSTGEKALMAISLLIFQTSNKRLSSIPCLFLLDEVDAPLHPTFTKQLLDFLKHDIVEALGVSVMLTTHSPSTVALAPKDSVFELVRSPRRLRRITGEDATQILSSGFVSITTSDTIVITESSSDQNYYQAIYLALVRTGHVPEQPPLKFVAASKRETDGVGGGVDQVKNWSRKLSELGLERFRGLIDLDEGRAETAVVKVIARYSIENYLYDPLTLCAFFVEKGANQVLPASALLRTPADIQSLDGVALQLLIDHTVRYLFENGASKIDLADKISVSYIGWSGIQIPTWWIKSKGREVETELEPMIDALCGTQRKRRLRHEELIRRQTAIPGSISADFKRIFCELRN